LNGGCVTGTTEIFAVTTRALLSVRRLTGLRLGRGKCAARRGLRLLTADRRDCETDEDSRSK
jgi:hypothetical protein